MLNVCVERSAENWVHVLVDCKLYDDLRDLSVIGVRVNSDGRVDVSAV